MSLRGRLDALSRAAQRDGLFAGGDCPACGSPDPRGARLVVVDGDHPLKQCPECRSALDAQGLPLAALAKVLVLEGEESDEIEDPT